MRILLTGCSGQVGYELERSLQALGEVVAVDRARMDLSDLDQVRSVVREVKPGLIVNPAAYTAVDKAESEPELARRINALAPAVMAEEARRLGAAMVHYSTDYVFDGSKPIAYVETDKTNPINVYGQTKLEGEQLIADTGVDHIILRTSWVYGLRGKNFLLTMLNLAKDRNELRVVADQHGAPTWSRTVADTTAVLLAQANEEGWWQRHRGVYHLSSRGTTTWFDFTRAIIRKTSIECCVEPISSATYPTLARRPMNSKLDAHKLESLCYIPEWESALELCLGVSAHP